MATCYICDKNNNISIYYKLKPRLYIDPKIYTLPITDDLKPICENCVIEFLFERQMGFDICGICKCYNKYSGMPPIITNDCKEIQSNAADGNYYFNGTNYPNLKDNDLLCKNCFQEIISKSDTIKKDFKQNNSRENLNCSKCNINWNDAKFPSDSSVLCWAKFRTDNIFSYGLAGEFKITSNNNCNFKNGDNICNDCLKSINYEKYLGTECDICHNKYPSMGLYMEGDNCASRIFDTIISGGYGSKYDSFSERECVRFASERPKELPHGALICDVCIDKLIENGTCLEPESYSDVYNDDLSVPIFTTLPNSQNMENTQSVPTPEILNNEDWSNENWSNETWANNLAKISNNKL